VVLLAVGGFILVEGVRACSNPRGDLGGMVVCGVVGLLGSTVSILLRSRVQAGA
jgi:Co/Zn/Cd efflux system component